MELGNGSIPLPEIEDAAIAVVDSWGIPQGVTVRNNVINNVNAVGIKVYDSQDLAGIYNNTLSSCGGVGIQAYPAVSVMNNLVFGNNGGGSQVSLGSGSSFRMAPWFSSVNT